MLSSHIQLKLLYLNYNFMAYKIFTDVTAKDKTVIKIDIQDGVPMKLYRKKQQHMEFEFIYKFKFHLLFQKVTTKTPIANV